MIKAIKNPSKKLKYKVSHVFLKNNNNKRLQNNSNSSKNFLLQ